MKTVSLCLALLLGGTLCFFCCCRKSSNKDDRPVLVMVTSANFPPYDYELKRNIMGIDVDIVAAVCRKLGMRLEVKNEKFNTILSRVIARRSTIAAAGITITPERKRHVLFTVPYKVTSQLIIVMSSNETIHSPEDLKAGIRVGCQRGTTGGDYLRREIITDPDSGLLHEFDSGFLAIEAMKAGIVDAVVLDEDPARALAMRHDGTVKILETPLTQEEYAIALNKDDRELCAAFDRIITIMKKYGELERIFQKHQAILRNIHKQKKK